MPFVRIDWHSGRTADQKREVATVLTRELARIAKCPAHEVQILFNDVDPNDWATGGKIDGDTE